MVACGHEARTRQRRPLHGPAVRRTRRRRRRPGVTPRDPPRGAAARSSRSRAPCAGRARARFRRRHRAGLLGCRPRGARAGARVGLPRVDELPVLDPDWEIGTQDVLALPLYQEMDGAGSVIDPDPHVIVNYDRIPKHAVEIRRSSAVMSADGHRLGHVDGFLVGSGETTDIVLERGHLWGRREVVIPAAAVARVENDLITLSVTKDEVGALAPRRVRRWS